MGNWWNDLLCRFRGNPPELLESANKQSEDISRRLYLLELDQERIRRRVQTNHPVLDVVAPPPKN